MKEHGNGSGSTRVYVVEARTSYSQPQKHCGMILDSEWRRVTFDKSRVGVPNLLLYSDAVQHGFFNYEAAMALAHWFMAMPNDDVMFPFPAICVETRLVAIEYSWNYSTKEIGVGAAISLARGGSDSNFSQRDLDTPSEGK